MTEANRGIIVVELVSLINKGNAHVSFDEAIEGISLELATKKPDALPYSVWELVEHIRITQWDIVEFCLGADHQSPVWPDEYWPSATAEITQQQWQESLSQIHKDRERFFEILKDQATDLYSPFEYGDGQNVLREALLIADHNSYHVGQIIVLRRLLGDWK
jgi:uncharacterized damage-inducible protein DinB